MITMGDKPIIDFTLKLEHDVILLYIQFICYGRRWYKPLQNMLKS